MPVESFRICFGNLPEPSLLLSSDGQVLETNAAARQLLGGSGDIVGHPLHGLVLDPPENVSRLITSCRGTRELMPGALTFRSDGGGTPCRVEGALFDAPSTTVLLRVFLKEDAPRQLHALTEMLETDSETLEERRAEAKRFSQQRWFHPTLESVGDAVIAADVNGTVTFLNHIAENLTGWTEQEALGRQLATIFVTTKLTNQTILTAKDGRQLPIEHGAVPIRIREGEVSGVVLIFRDVTAARVAVAAEQRSIEALRNSEQTYRAIGEAISYGVWICEPDGHNTYASKSFLDLVGMTQEECASFGWGAVLHPDDTETTIAAWKECVRTGDLWNREHRFRGVDGQYHWVLARGVPIRNELGEVIRWAGINLDIGQAKVVEESLRASEAELRRANDALVRANEDLNQFAFAASHDLQEPLRMITSFSQLLLQSWTEQRSEDANMAARMIGEGTRRMQNLLRDLLAYTQVSAESEQEPATVDLNTVLTGVLQNLKNLIETNGGVVTSGSLPTVRGEEAHFLQLFQNLIENAIKYRGVASPVVRLSAEPWEGGWRITVADNGIGIDPQYHNQIFGVFKRLHGRSIPGTGIGLALCQRVVERYGGKLTVESHLGSGASFRFTLPRSAAPAETKNVETKKGEAADRILSAGHLPSSA